MYADLGSRLEGFYSTRWPFIRCPRNSNPPRASTAVSLARLQVTLVGIKAVLLGACLPVLPCILVGCALTEYHSSFAGKATSEFFVDTCRICCTRYDVVLSERPDILPLLATTKPLSLRGWETRFPSVCTHKFIHAGEVLGLRTPLDSPP